MQVYIASKFEDKDRVRDLMYLFAFHGHIVTKDWTISTEECLREAEEDIEGVKNCDTFVGLFDKEYAYRGAIVELGIAIALNKRIFIVGSYLDPMIFMLLPNVVRLNNIEHLKTVLRLN